MSSYMSFFIGGEDNKFYPIGSYSRNSAIYSMFDSMEIGPYEKIEAITEAKLNKVESFTERQINKWIKTKIQIEEKISLVKSLEGPIEERISIWDELKDELCDCKTTIEELEEVKSFVWFLKEAITEVKWDDRFNITPENYLYAGIEIEYPTIDDIIEGVY